MRAMGLDLSGHRSRPLTPELADGALLLCMTRGHVDAARGLAPGGRAMLLSEYAGASGEVPDPYGQSDAVYRRTAELLGRHTDAIAASLAGEGAR